MRLQGQDAKPCEWRMKVPRKKCLSHDEDATWDGRYNRAPLFAGHLFSIYSTRVLNRLPKAAFVSTVSTKSDSRMEANIQNNKKWINRSTAVKAFSNHNARRTQKPLFFSMI